MTKKNLKLFIVLIILAGLAYVYQGPFKNWRQKSEKPKNFLASLKIEDIDRIEIAGANGSSTLEKIDTRWKVGGTKAFYVKDDIAKEISDKLGELKTAQFDLASSNKDKKKDFGLEADTAVTVALYRQGDEKGRFIIGRMGNDYQSTYIAKDLENPETYIVKLSLSMPFSMDDFRDTMIFSSDKAKISKIKIRTKSGETVIEKKGDKWEGVKPQKFAVNKDKADKMLETISSLEAVRIPEQTFKGTDLEKNLLIVEATGDGINNTLMVGKDAGEGQYYVKKGDNDNIYLITKDQRDSLNKTMKDLK